MTMPSGRAIALLILLAVWLSGPAKGDSKTIVALSMREMQRAIEKSSNLDGFPEAQPEIYYLGGITWPWAVVFDPGSRDWILVGERDPDHSLLSLDDWVAAVRTRFLFPGIDPGVTILPTMDGCDPARLSECLRRPHRVEFFAGIQDTEFGATCLAADVLLKRIVLGLESPPPNLKFASWPSLLRQGVNDDSFSLIFNRFWIYPLISEVNVADNVALLERFQLGVLTEVMYTRDREGREVDASSFSDPAANRIAKSLSDGFPILAQRWRELDRLQGLGRLASLAKGLQTMPAGQDVQVLLSGYRSRGVPTDEEVSIHQIPVTPDREVLGGVQLDALLFRLNDGDLEAFRELVLVSRPKREAVVWEFTAVVENGRFAALRYALPSVDASRVGPLLQQARLFSARGYYEPSLQLYDRIVKEFPNNEEARIGRTLALFRLGQAEAAMREADYAVSIRGSEDALLLRAILRAMGSSPRAALEDLDRATKLNPSVTALFLRAMLHWQRSDLKNDASERQHALADLNRILVMLPDDPMATLYRGFVHLSGALSTKSPGSLSSAMDDFSKVAGTGALRTKALLGRGLALVLAKRYSAALVDLDEAIKAFPKDSLARLARAEAREALRQYPGAAMDRRMAVQGDSTILTALEGVIGLLNHW